MVLRRTGGRSLDLERSRNIPCLSRLLSLPHGSCSSCVCGHCYGTGSRSPSSLLHPWEQNQLGDCFGLVLAVGELYPAGVRTVWSHVLGPRAGIFASTRHLHTEFGDGGPLAAVALSVGFGCNSCSRIRPAGEPGEGSCPPGKALSDPDICPGNRNPFFFPFSFLLSHYCPFVVRQHCETSLMFFVSSPSRLRRKAPPACFPSPALPFQLQSPSAQVPSLLRSCTFV